MLRRLQTELSLALFAVTLLVAGYGAAWSNQRSVSDLSVAEIQAALFMGAVLVLTPIAWALSRMAGDELLFPACAMLIAIGSITMRRLQPEIGGAESDLGDLSSRHTV